MLQCIWILASSLGIIRFMEPLLSQCLDGLSGAWDTFVDRYAPVILSAVRHTIRTYSPAMARQMSEDIAQNVFLKLINRDFRLLRTYDPSRASLATWLTIITRSTTIDYLRRKRLSTIPLDQAPPVEVSSADPENTSSATQDLPTGLLTARQRLILQLLFDRQMSPDDISRILGISPQTVRSSKHKAIQRLREHFGSDDSS